MGRLGGGIRRNVMALSASARIYMDWAIVAPELSPALKTVLSPSYGHNVMQRSFRPPSKLSRPVQTYAKRQLILAVDNSQVRSPTRNVPYRCIRFQVLCVILLSWTWVFGLVTIHCIG